MTTDATTPKFTRPSPALTPAQRLHFEVQGYVVVPNVLTRDECEAMRSSLRRLRGDLLAAGPAEPRKAAVRGAFFEAINPHHAFMANFYEYDDTLLGYACHPRVVGLCEEIMGCPGCLIELNGHLNSRDPGADVSKPPQYGFHTGVDVPFGTHVAHGLTHCTFVKALTTLTDLGPDDGGTTVVAGSHKISAPQKEITDLAYEDRRLIHQFIAPAGSVLLFPETLIHATGRITSDIERAIIIAGYAPRMYQRWDHYSQTGPIPGTGFSPEFIARIPDPLRPLLLGTPHWARQQRYRTLADPADTTAHAPVPWPAC